MTHLTTENLARIAAVTSTKEADYLAIDFRAAKMFDLAAMAEDRGADLCVTSAAAWPRRDAANIDRYHHLNGE